MFLFLKILNKNNDVVRDRRAHIACACVNCIISYHISEGQSSTGVQLIEIVMSLADELLADLYEVGGENNEGEEEGDQVS